MKMQKYKTISIQQTNEADTLLYKKTLSKLTVAMLKEYHQNILNYYKQYRHYIVGDFDIVTGLQNIIDRIGKKWFDIFNRYSFDLAKKTVYKVTDFSIKQFERIKNNNPFLLKNTKNLQQTTKIVEASIAENVGLIKSIPTELHDKILGSVMRSVSSGNNLQQLTQDLSKITNQTKKRIDLIATNQIAKATALINQQNAIDAGLNMAIWKKSIAGKTHRQSHADADGKEFNITKGCLIDGKYILPREEINCKCSYKLIIK